MLYQGQQPKKSNTWKWALGILSAVLVVCVSGFISCTAMLGSAANSIEEEQHDKTAGVTIEKCKIEGASSDLLPAIEVDLSVKNATDNQQTYFIDLFIKDENEVRLAEGLAVVSNVRPDQEAKHTTTIYLTKKIPAGTKVSCTVDKVR